jgi:hypothetical protein
LPVETDAALRRRQTQSVANPSQTVVLGITGAIENILGVSRVMIYENPHSTSDINGLPPYSMAIVVQGGDIQAVADAIALRKTPGSPTYGTTSVMVFDSRGVPSVINFFELTLVPISVAITITALPGFTANIEAALAAQVIAFLSTLPIGYNSFISKLIAACQLPEPDGLTYDVITVTQSRGGAALAATDVVISYIEACVADSTTIAVTVNVVPGQP